MVKKFQKRKWPKENFKIMWKKAKEKLAEEIRKKVKKQMAEKKLKMVEKEKKNIETKIRREKNGNFSGRASFPHHPPLNENGRSQQVAQVNTVNHVNFNYGQDVNEWLTSVLEQHHQ